MNKLTLLISILFLSFITNASAKTYTGEQADSLVSGSLLVIVHDDYQTLKSVRFDDKSLVQATDKKQWLTELLAKFSGIIELEFTDKELDNIGHKHYSYKQKVNDVLVEHSMLKVHTKNGMIYGVTAEYFPIDEIVSGPVTYTEADALAYGQNYLEEKSCDVQTNEVTSAGAFYIKRPGQPLSLCFKIDAHGSVPKAVRAFLYLSQTDGSLLFEENRIIHTNATGTGHSKYNGPVTITTDSLSPTNFELTQNGARQITTKNLNNGTSYTAATSYTDTDNIWNTDSIAIDVHYGAEKTHEYFLSTHGLNSYDNLGARINSYVHYGSNFVNAFWDGVQMTYGDGDGVNYGPLTSIDVVAHEITHAVTQNSANLVYSNESGALNESFSDIFAIAIEHFSNPAAGNFTLGEQFVLGNNQPFRDLSDPNSLNDPDTYLGNHWDFATQSVHNNGTVHTYWFYLLCTGGSGVNDNTQSYSVNSIGMADAAAIAYRALTVYLTPNSTYSDSRFATIQSAIDLFGTCSAQEIQVTNAWHAVGVGGVYSNAITASFTPSATSLCTVPASVGFTNTSNNATSYQWDFGDGNTSTSASPTNIYATAGTYTVQLIANGTTVCGGADTIVLSNLITVTNGGGPISATCAPATLSYCCGNGITTFQLATINSSSNNASEGYQDFTCGQNATVTTGSNYQYNITLGGTINQNYKIFADLDNNGAFSATEELAAGTSLFGLQNGFISFPTSAVLNTPIRLRVISYTGSLANACTDPINGQVEDYTVTIVAPTSPPIADFTTASFTVTSGTTVALQDISTNGPSSWNWTIPGGTTASSTLQNPTTQFNAPGTYPVKLVASNSFGSDSITYNINVVSTFTMCVDDSSTSTAGTIYDSGGPLGNYSNGESCSFLISPGSCTDSIVLNFISFNTESCCDYLRIYNGPTTASPILYQAGGSALPPNITGTAEEMLLYFYSDGSVISTGFEVNWTSYQQAAVAPTANFTFTPNNLPVLDTVSFTDASSANATAWNWNFGDGSTSNLQNPTHPYALPGVYPVTLIVESCNAYDTLVQNVTVQASPTVVYNPTSFNVSLGCNDTVDVNLLISNIAGGTLNWNLGGTGGSSSIGGNEILAWTYGVDMFGEYPNMIAALNQHYTNYTLSTTATTTPSVMQSLLANKKILLIPEKESGNIATVTPFASVIQNYVQNGGTVIVCGDNIATALNIGLFTGTYQNFTTSTLNVVNTTTPLSDSIPASFPGPSATFYYDITNSNKVKVVDFTGNDVVTYMPYGQGKAIFLGFDYFAVTNPISQILGNAVRFGMQGNSGSANVQINPISGSVTNGNTDTAVISINSSNLSGGLDTLYIFANSNDTSSLTDTIPIYLNISTMPCVNFGADVTNSCTGIVSFIDSTLNNPTSWTWDFGDGNTSSSQNPTHIYAAAGTYQVKLIATNATGTDSLTKTVNINATYGPLGAACSPISNNPNTFYGIQSVSLGNINSSTSNATEGYMDLTCTDTTTLSVGTQYQLNINTFNNFDKIYVWIDTNNDGQFATNELLASITTTTATLKQTILSIPASGISMNTPLRMRVMANYNTPSSACDLPLYGQVEDYTVTIVPPSAAPIADFTTASFTVATNTNLTLQDISSNGPTSWTWTIANGTPTSSTVQNPITLFTTPGSYPVKLVASNSFGSDSITKIINVISISTMCTNDSSTNVFGTVYDSGGPTGNYSNSEYCTFLISPGACTDSITLDFISFTTESGYDYLRVYDGPTVSSPLIGTYNGSFTPANLTGSADKMLLLFTSDGSVTQAGFEITWTSFQQASTAPTANFTFTPNNLPVLDTVNFTDASTTNASNWSWDFGDGTTSNLQNPSHPYALPGNYQVTLIAGSCNAYDTITQTVTVQASPTVVYNPTSFNVNLGCNDTVNVDLLISNIAGGTLNWNLGGNGNSNIGGNEILAWTYGVDMTGEYPNMIAALNQHYTNYTLSTTATTTPSVMQSLLANKKILLIPEKESGNIATVTPFASVIQNYVQNGGTVIVCGDNIATALNIGLFTGTYQNFTTGTLNVVNTTTPLSDSIPASFPGPSATFYYDITNSNKVKVVDFTGNDVVTYMPYGQGKAIFLGFDYFAVTNPISQILGNAVRFGMQGNFGPNGNNIQINPTSGSLTSGNTDTVNIQLNSTGLTGGLDTLYIITNSNDTSSLTDTIPVYLNISTDPCINFGHQITNICSGQVQFTDSTTNTPTSWLWNFGDGNTSNAQNPLHTYLTPGTYQVKLVATNSTSSDSLTQTVVVNFISGPINTTCNMPTTISCCGYGLVEFELGAIHSYTGSDTEGYQDLSCLYFDYVNKGATYPFTITTANTNSQYFSIYLDYNNDGTFTGGELLVTNAYNFGTYSGNITIPSTGVTTNTGLRLRVVASDNAHTACNSIAYGQAEDYTLIIQDSIPTANFTANPTTAYVNQAVQFTDLTTSNPSAWNWNLPGANTVNPTTQNPLVSYATAGVYNATLIASNLVGADTFTQTNYITIQDLPNTNFTHVNIDCEGRVDFSASLPVPYTNVRWYFGDGDSLNSNGNTATHVYANNGTYNVMLVAYSQYGNDTITLPVAVSVWYPTITTTGSIGINNPITFSVNSTNTINSYLWDFGNSNTSSLGSPTNTYTNGGVFYVSVEVEDDNGCKKTIYDTIRIIADAVINVGNESNIKVYPNPFNNELELEFIDLGLADKLSITIYNSVSQVIYKKEASRIDLNGHKLTINSSEYSDGNYIVKINIDGTIYNLKLLKVDK